MDFILNKSIAKHFDAFNRGFHKVCGGRVLRLFQSHELMDLVVGKSSFRIGLECNLNLVETTLFDGFCLKETRATTGMLSKRMPSTKTVSAPTTQLSVYFGKSSMICRLNKRRISFFFLRALIVYPYWEWKLSKYIHFVSFGTIM